MSKFGLLVIVCALGASACSHLREPTDAQLRTLLRTERALPNNANAPLDTNAIDCLRSWSGDAALLKGLPIRLASEEGRQACRSKLDAWIADPTRNADKLSFEEVSAPKAARRAGELQEARQVAAVGDPATQRIPAALANSPMPSSGRNIDVDTARARLQEADTLCQQAQQAANSTAASQPLKVYAGYCAKSLGRLHASIERLSGNSQMDAKQLSGTAISADNMAKTARNLLTGDK